MKKFKIAGILADLLILAGFVAVAAGVGLISAAGGVIAGGVLSAALGFLIHKSIEGSEDG